MFVCAVLATLAAAAGVGGQPIPERLVTAKVVWSVARAHRGGQRVAAVVVDISPGFHINPPAAQLDDDTLIPTLLQTTAGSSGLIVGPVRYPSAGFVVVGPEAEPRRVRAYEGRVVFHVPVEVERSAQPGDVLLGLELVYQACDRTRCLPPVTLDLSTALRVVDESAAIDETVVESELFRDFDRADGPDPVVDAVAFDAFGLGFSLDVRGWAGFAWLLLVAGVGGLLLNFTPCVLPVIPLKMMGLSRSAGNRGRCLALGLMMCLGVVGFWLGLGAAIATVGGFTATNQLFQFPAFSVSMGLLIGAMAVGMFGLFTVRLPRWVYAFDPQADSLGGSFGLGVMTAVLSTPCTAPFMGAAAAWAAGQEPAVTLATFAAIGAGMALPYGVLSAFPGLVRRMPRSGPAGELIKQVMGLMLLAVAAYFIGVGLAGLGVEPGEAPSLTYWWPVMAFAAAGGGWLAYRTAKITRSWVRRVVFVALGLGMMIGAFYGGVRLTDRGPVDWVYYTPDRYADALNGGNIVVLDFTAEWCLNCKWLEKNVLSQSEVVRELSQPGVVAMKVDLTGSNEAGSKKLRELDRVAIPLLVVVSPDGREVFKGDFYTASQVVEAIGRARGLNK